MSRFILIVFSKNHPLSLVGKIGILANPSSPPPKMKLKIYLILAPDPNSLTAVHTSSVCLEIHAE